MARYDHYLVKAIHRITATPHPPVVHGCVAANSATGINAKVD
ncbi:MAG: hypothetical protein ABL891_01035 [Burkholderiales bacterium]